ncbi:unnamed protein product [Larinioides sclopetarius]|uniref:Uncharacterized protein n=1 Tax=Larinioides sclopetarius TaxID=280406 RepID=A0AAV2AQX1_9ARAC
MHESYGMTEEMYTQSPSLRSVLFSQEESKCQCHIVDMKI